MPSRPIVSTFDLHPRDTLCQCVGILRAKWQPRRVLAPLVEPYGGTGQEGSWPLPQERSLKLENLRREWRVWLEREGLPLVAGHVLAVSAAAAHGEARVVGRMDAEQDQRMSAEKVRVSRNCGAMLLLACDGLRHGGVLGHLQRQWLDGRPCHWGTAWGALAALFSMPPAGAALVALFGEWEALDPLERRDRPIGEAVAWFARDSGSALTKCQWIERRLRQAILRIA